MKFSAFFKDSPWGIKEGSQNLSSQKKDPLEGLKRSFYEDRNIKF